MSEEYRTIGVRVNATAANSFPALVATERAARAIVDLDRSSENGAILVVDEDGDRVVRQQPYPEGFDFGCR